MTASTSSAWSRRRFLAATATISGTLWASSTALLALAPGPVWALPLDHLDAEAGNALLVLARHIYPHPTLDDAVYAFVVKALDDAAATPAVAELVYQGVAALDTAAGGRWLDTPAERQLTIVNDIAGQPFFEKVRATAVVALYNNELAFAHFGYEGNAFARGGGYLHRGFNDLTWLPAPPPEASPEPG